MSLNQSNPYDVEKHISEIYDKQESGTEDVECIIKLAYDYNCNTILEPFCGTGRILLPLLEKGFNVTGIDESKVMIQLLRSKLENNKYDLTIKPKIICSDALDCDWHDHYDLIVLGNNCFFELPTLEDQENLIIKAFKYLNSGGYLFIDNDNIEGELPEHWCKIGTETPGFPTGFSNDKTELRSFVNPIFVDSKNKIWRAERRTEVYQDGVLMNTLNWTQQKHAIGYSEIEPIINKLDMTILNKWNGTDGLEFDPLTSKRATLWAQKNG